MEEKKSKELFHVEQFLEILMKHLEIDGFVDNVQKYFKEYSLWNSRINLSTIRTESAFWLRHVLDSIVLAYIIDRDFKGKKLKYVVDLGTGGGFPGIVLALLLKKTTILVDKRAKKLKFLDEAINTLSLENPEILTKQVNFLEQNLVKTMSLDPFHTVFVSRAVDIRSLSEFVKRHRIKKLYIMTTSKAFKQAISDNKVSNNLKKIRTETVFYKDILKEIPILKESFDHFSDYLVLKMFHVEHF